MYDLSRWSQLVDANAAFTLPWLRWGRVAISATEGGIGQISEVLADWKRQTFEAAAEAVTAVKALETRMAGTQVNFEGVRYALEAWKTENAEKTIDIEARLVSVDRHWRRASHTPSRRPLPKGNARRNRSSKS